MGVSCGVVTLEKRWRFVAERCPDTCAQLRGDCCWVFERVWLLIVYVVTAILQCDLKVHLALYRDVGHCRLAPVRICVKSHKCVPRCLKWLWSVSELATRI